MSDLSSALSFTIPGKTAKQLEEWCKQYRHAEWQTAVAASAGGKPDRYTFVRIVEEGQKQIREQDGHAGEDDDGDSQASASKPRRKVRTWMRGRELRAFVCGPSDRRLLTVRSRVLFLLARSRAPRSATKAASPSPPARASRSAPRPPPAPSESHAERRKRRTARVEMGKTRRRSARRRRTMPRAKSRRRLRRSRAPARRRVARPRAERRRRQQKRRRRRPKRPRAKGRRGSERRRRTR